MALRVFITGGASGLGRAFAQRYAKDGARLLLGDIHAARMDETVEALRALGAEADAISCDVRKEADLVAAARWCEERWGGVDRVFNNAGVSAGGSIDAQSISDWEWIVDINLLGVARGCKAFVPLLKRQRSGRIVNTASMAGLTHPPQMAAYNATKAAVVSISETMRTELAEHGIGVSVVCPSFVRTNLLDNFRGATPDVQRTTTRLLTKAKQTPDEVASLVHRGVERGEFLILTDRGSRQAYLAKRWLPGSVFAGIVEKRAKRAMEQRPETPDA
ncbi:MAG TPA: SDR family oxidoreductase [Candidatus Thermoplasmatota archaeon]|nr:SDR family oxidoreductase [Candidatus Thermoplasmatota archaeon]